MPALSPEGCAARRGRLLEVCHRLELDAALITDVRDVYYFTGALLPSDLPAAWFIDASGPSVLVGPASSVLEEWASRGESCLSYEWNHRGTRHPDACERMADAFRQAAAGRDFSTLGVQCRSAFATSPLAGRLAMQGATQAVDEEIAALQRRKDDDEVRMIRASIEANLGAYQAVREAIQPGATELDVLAAGYRGAMLAAGEKVFHDGDYQCGAYNGPARDRPIQAGELYIVDAWTCYRGYWSDMSRTFFVGRGPTDEQYELYEHVRRVQQRVAELLKPGADGSEIYTAIDGMLREHPQLEQQGLVHHGGHAIGLRSHEMPDVNEGRGGVLEPGQIICIEPGGYFAAARYGVRLENMYLITPDGCEDLCPAVGELYECV
ncbi:MAG: aminopeptidase P family protein [Pirellulales bacterium]|nr:aminopeptidase P family protein [Pirellulales bacterium]